MWPFRIRGAATFIAPEGTDGSMAVATLREALARNDTLEVVEGDSTLDFDMGPPFLRVDLAFKPFSRLKGIRRGRVGVRSSGRKVDVTFDLRMAWDDLAVPALLLAVVSVYADSASVNHAGPGLEVFLFLGGLLVAGWTLFKVILAARFARFVEHALYPMWRE